MRLYKPLHIKAEELDKLDNEEFKNTINEILDETLNFLDLSKMESSTDKKWKNSLDLKINNNIKYNNKVEALVYLCFFINKATKNKRWWKEIYQKEISADSGDELNNVLNELSPDIRDKIRKIIDIKGNNKSYDEKYMDIYSKLISSKEEDKKRL